MNYKRYQRHFPVMGIAGQQKLQDASICIVGCGGIGSPVLMYLAAAGVGKLGLIDFDVVELSNLQRQILFTEKDIGVTKSYAGLRHLQEINRDIKLVQYNERLNFERACEIFLAYDLVIDGSDNFTTRYAVNDACCKLNKPFISASVLRSQAQLAFFDPAFACYRCLYPSAPPEYLIPNCSEAGVLGACVGVVGTMAANLVINFILGKEIKQNLMIFESDQLTWQSYQYKQNPSCKSCVTHEFGVKQEKILGKEIKMLNVLETDAFIIDVRENWEIEIAPLDCNCCLIELSNIMQGELPKDLRKDQKIILICKLGGRSQKAAQKLIELGFKNVYNYEGGIARYYQKKHQALCY